jgi:hypothetical protein
MAADRRADVLIRRLGAGAASAQELEQVLGVSQPTVNRLLRELIDARRVLRTGTTRGAQYGLRRSIDSIGDAWPLHRIDQAGAVRELGTLFALAADQYCFEPTGTSLRDGFAWSGISEGVPYFLQDQRPGGFLGRAVPRFYAELNLPQRVVDWNDDHYLRYLTQRGSDALGDLILGSAALDEYLRLRSTRTAVLASERSVRYPQLAAAAMEGGLPGSSAHGEHPKFTALLQDESGQKHVLVKFSPPTTTGTGARWSDLLIAEHHAHVVLRKFGVTTASSRIFQFAARTYLEVDRFDRVGAEGRLGLVSLLAIDAQLYGKLDNWVAAMLRLERDNHVDVAAVEEVRLISTFGSLIANTDRHFGNLSFFDEYRGTFRLAPVYDMLPMLFAPEHDQIVQREFIATGPTSDTLRAFPRACEAAQEFWRRVTDDTQVSNDFRKIATKCEATVRKVAVSAPSVGTD